MPQMNNNQARVADPILSEHARGYRQAELVGRALFPFAPVAIYGGKVVEFKKEAFKLYNSRRAPGAATKRVSFGYEGKSYAIIPSALEAKVPREIMRDAAQVPGIDLASRAVNTVMRSLLLEHEFYCAQLAREANNYDADHKVSLVGAGRWTHKDSDPIGDVERGKEAIRRSIGVRPNTIEISASSLAGLIKHPQLLDRASQTGIKTVNQDLLKAVFQIQDIVIGEAVLAADDDSFGDVWGDDVVLAYVSKNPSPAAEEPSYGYTYQIEGHPLVEQPYWDANAKSWIYGVSYDNTPVLSGMTAGYVIKNAGAAAA